MDPTRTALMFLSVVAATVLCIVTATLAGLGRDGYIAMCVSIALLMYAVHQFRYQQYIFAYGDEIERRFAAGELSEREREELSTVPEWKWGNGVGPLPNWKLAAGLASFGFLFAIIPGVVAAQFGYL